MENTRLQRLFEISYSVIEADLAGVDHAMSMQIPPGGNCLNWVVGHILASRILLHRILDIEPVWTDEDAAPYDRGTPPLTAASQVARLEDMVADLEVSQHAVITALEGAGEELMARGTQFGSVADALFFLHFHESYHAGQLGILRRLSGLAGAIP
ncbi:DinB family protein [bacterium]|nr:DinB family protein [candidate division CSSED10-310 bacterium]